MSYSGGREKDSPMIMQANRETTLEQLDLDELRLTQHLTDIKRAKELLVKNPEIEELLTLLQRFRNIF